MNAWTPKPEDFEAERARLRAGLATGVPPPHPTEKKTMPAEKTLLPRLVETVERALAGDKAAAQQLRTLGEALDLTGGADALVKLQGALHDYAVEHLGNGSRGDAIGAYWEHIPAWSSL